MKYELAILLAFGKLGKNVYEGTVPYATKQKRRVRNKVARAQNRLNRR